jgi:hypothetical protein
MTCEIKLTLNFLTFVLSRLTVNLVYRYSHVFSLRLAQVSIYRNFKRKGITMHKFNFTMCANETTSDFPLITLPCKALMAASACYKYEILVFMHKYIDTYIPPFFHILKNNNLLINLFLDQPNEP